MRQFGELEAAATDAAQRITQRLGYSAQPSRWAWRAASCCAQAPPHSR
jgi:hypothetical protein